jgi:hypothetical protein
MSCGSGTTVPQGSYKPPRTALWLRSTRPRPGGAQRGGASLQNRSHAHLAQVTGALVKNRGANLLLPPPPPRAPPVVGVKAREEPDDVRGTLWRNVGAELILLGEAVGNPAHALVPPAL